MTLTEYNNIVRIIMDIDSHTEPTSSAIILDWEIYRLFNQLQ